MDPPALVAPVRGAAAKLEGSTPAIQVEELEQVREGDLRETAFDLLGRLAHHRVELGAADHEIRDALADLVGIRVERERDSAPLRGRRVLRIGEEDEADPARTGVRAQDLHQLAGLDEGQRPDRDQHVGHLRHAGLERIGPVHDGAGREAAHGAGLPDPVRAVRVGVGDDHESAHGSPG